MKIRKWRRVEPWGEDWDGEEDSQGVGHVIRSLSLSKAENASRI